MAVLLLLAAVAGTADEFDAPAEMNKTGCEIRSDKLAGKYYLYVRAGWEKEEGIWRWRVLYSVRDDIEQINCECGKWMKRQQQLAAKRERDGKNSKDAKKNTQQ